MNFRNISSNKEFIFTGRVLLQASRTPHKYFLRAGILVFLMLIFQPFLEISRLSGMMLFNAMIIINFLYLSFYSCIVFASMISSEKESGTLGLLMMTPRKPASLLAAKSIPISLEILNSLLLQLPIFIICIALGGVDAKQIPQIILLLINHVLLLGSIGIFFSSWCKNSKLAVNYTIFSALTFFFGPLIIDRVQAAYFPHTESLSLMSKLDPLNNLMTLEKIMSFNNELQNILISGAFSTIVALLSVYLSTKILEKSSLSTTADLGKNKNTTKKHRRAWKQALIGKDFHLNGGIKFQSFKIIGYPIIAVFIYRYLLANTPLDPSSTLEIICLLFFGAFLIEILAYGTQAFSLEIKDKQMSSLLLLPVSSKIILLDKMKAIFLSSIVPLIYGMISLLISPDLIDDFREALKSPISFALISVYIVIFLMMINGALVKSIKPNFAQKTRNFILYIIFYIFIAKPMLENFSRNPTLFSFAVIVLALIFAYYILTKILKNLTIVAQQEN